MILKLVRPIFQELFENKLKVKSNQSILGEASILLFNTTHLKWDMCERVKFQCISSHGNILIKSKLNVCPRLAPFSLICFFFLFSTTQFSIK